MRRPNKFTAATAAYFRRWPYRWINGLELQAIGGAYAWRSRVSDCRTDLGMTIENRQRLTDDGYRVSEYRYVPTAMPEAA